MLKKSVHNGLIEHGAVDNNYIEITFKGGYDRNGDYLTMSYNKSYPQPILENPQDYYLTVARATIPMSCVPLLYIYIQEGIAQSDPDLTNWSFCFRYSGTDFFEDVIYVPNNNITVPNAPSANGGFQVLSEYYNVYNYQTVVDMLNTALTASFTAMKTAYPAITPTEAPYFIYDNETEIFSLIYQSGYIGSGIELYMNDDLRTYFNFFKLFKYGNNNVNGKDYQFIFSDDKNNLYSVGYYQNTQCIRATPRYINVVNKIIFVSENLPVNPMWIPSAPRTNTSGGFSDISQANIIFDLDPILDLASDSTSKLVYNPTVYRYCDLIGTSPIKTIKMNVFFTDFNDNVFPICLQNGISANVLLYFCKKSLVNNQFTEIN